MSSTGYLKRSGWFGASHMLAPIPAMHLESDLFVLTKRSSSPERSNVRPHDLMKLTWETTVWSEQIWVILYGMVWCGLVWGTRVACYESSKWCVGVWFWIVWCTVVNIFTLDVQGHVVCTVWYHTQPLVLWEWYMVCCGSVWDSLVVCH